MKKMVKADVVQRYFGGHGQLVENMDVSVDGRLIAVTCCRTVTVIWVGEDGAQVQRRSYDPFAVDTAFRFTGVEICEGGLHIKATDYKGSVSYIDLRANVFCSQIPERELVCLSPAAAAD